MPHLAIHLFGSPRIELDNTPISVDTRKATALVAYLAVAGGAHERRYLTELLWTGNNRDRARAALRRTLSVLKKALGEEWLLVGGGKIGLRSENGYWNDVQLFRQQLAACRAHGHAAEEVCPACLPILTEAVNLCHHPFLSDFYLRDAVLFDTWQVTEAEALLQEQGSVLERLVRYRAMQGDFEAAVTHARNWLLLDPTQETAHRYLMELYAQMGQRAAALRQYDACAYVLDQTLGIAPAVETTRLRQQIEAEEEGERQTAVSHQPVTPPPVSVSAAPTAKRAVLHLPMQFAPCIGREVEVAEISERLALPHCRLLTITGMGGIGKTRLAIQVATQLAERFADGVYFVPLAAVETAVLLETAVSEALQLSYATNLDPRRHLLDYLQGKQVLLLFDNFEHLLGRADLLLQIVQQAPQVKILVTSRTCLNFQAEWLYELGGLAYPETVSVDEGWNQYSAVRLFLYHAKRVHTDLPLSRDDQAAVLRICRLLQGLPLGVELAAALMHASTAAELVEQVADNLTHLTTTMGDVPARHRSLRAVFAHSWHMLAASEQEVLARLSIFRGSFTMPAAKEIAGAEPALVSELVDKSFLREMVNGRYEMHALLQRFAREELMRRPDEEERVRERYRRYFTALLQQKVPQLKAGRQKESIAEIAWELDHIRAAWQLAHTRRDVAAGQDLLRGLYLFYELSSRYHEGIECFAQALESYSSSTQESVLPMRGSLLVRLGSLQQRLCRYGPAREQLQAGLELLLADGDRAEVAFAHNQLAIVQFRKGNFAEAETAFCRSLALNDAIDDEWLKAHTLNGLGNVYRVLGRYDAAAETLRRALALRRRLDDRMGTAVSLNNLGSIAELQGEYEEARHLFQESLGLKQQMGDLKGIAHARLNLGYALYRLAYYDEARELLTKSLAEFRELGHVTGVAMSYANLGNVSRAVQDYAAANHLFRQSLDLFREVGNKREIVFSLIHLGNVANALTNYEEARDYFTQALTLAAEINTVPQMIEALVGIGQLFLNCGKRAHAATVLRSAARYPISRRELTDQTQEILLESVKLENLVPDGNEDDPELSLDAIVSMTLAMLAAD